MIRKVTMAILIILAAFLQCLLFQHFEVASIKPNLMLIIVTSFALMRGRRSGMIIGFFGGLAIDVLFPGALGFQALIYMWIGYAAGFCYRIFYDDDIKTPLLLIVTGELVYGLYTYIFSFLIRGRINILFYLKRIIIPELLYTLIITLVCYRLLFGLNRKLNKTDKRSIDSLV